MRPNISLGRRPRRLKANQTWHDIPVEATVNNLAKPLSPEAMELLKKSLKDVETASQSRLNTALPENSEPCTIYRAEPREVRSK